MFSEVQLGVGTSIPNGLLHSSGDLFLNFRLYDSSKKVKCNKNIIGCNRKEGRQLPAIETRNQEDGFYQIENFPAKKLR